jgi:hypothetical protein
VADRGRATVTEYVGDIQGVGNVNLAAPSTSSPFTPVTPVRAGRRRLHARLTDQPGRQDGDRARGQLVVPAAARVRRSAGSATPSAARSTSRTTRTSSSRPSGSASPPTPTASPGSGSRSTPASSAPRSPSSAASAGGAPRPAPSPPSATSASRPAGGSCSRCSATSSSPTATVTLQKPQTTLKDAESANPIQSVQVLQPSGTTKSQAAAIIIRRRRATCATRSSRREESGRAPGPRRQLVPLLEETVHAHHDIDSLFGPPSPSTPTARASSRLCYKAAGAPDPNGFGYSPLGDTASLVARGTRPRRRSQATSSSGAGSRSRTTSRSTSAATRS